MLNALFCFLVIGNIAILNAETIKGATFSDQYIRQNNQKVSVEVPEVRELINVIFAITPNGMSGDILRLHQIMNENDWLKKYYHEVLINFLPHYNHPVVTKFNNWMNSDFMNYPIVNLNSYGFVFENDKIVRTNIHNYFWDISTDELMSLIIKDLEDFAIKSGFREFYKRHHGFYQAIIKTESERASVSQMWSWLEEQFPNKINSYKILISPLVYGFHCTGYNSDNNFNEIVVSVSAPNEKISKGSVVERRVFTEIDHNYVNPLVEKNIERVQSAFFKTSIWKKGAVAYDASEEIFAEYMTWAVFLLYIHDTYDSVRLLEAEEETIAMMIQTRGFLGFREFYYVLREMYESKSDGQTIADLYLPILEWASKQ